MKKISVEADMKHDRYPKTGRGQNANRVSSVETKRRSEHGLSNLEIPTSSRDVMARALDKVENFGKPQVQRTSKKTGF